MFLSLKCSGWLSWFVVDHKICCLICPKPEGGLTTRDKLVDLSSQKIAMDTRKF